ncbi:hypothetical protein ACQKMD_21765 [Viridibacillus sp. NPDC096237]|uniref:hypothetical protein n=1 Tax=Viridibacillus sp. NPDC096237 TaxID=3390721 RepID=UPI003CFD364B
MVKKFLVLFSIVVVMFSSFVSFSKISHASEVSDRETTFSEIDEELIQAAEKVSSYFSVDEDENIIFNADRDTLISDLGVSEKDADLMILAVAELTSNNKNPKIQPYGFVGVYLHLGPKVRAMNGWAAGAFAAGYVGWYAKQFAVNPITAGVAGLITAGTALAVKNAVEDNVKKVSLGLNILGLNWSYDVDIP